MAEGSTIADEHARLEGPSVPNGKTRELGGSRAGDVIKGASIASRLATRLKRLSGRPTLVAVAAMNAITGLAAAATLAPVAFGADANTFRGCALWVAEGRTDFCGFLYAPLTALVARPLTWVSPTGAAVVMTLLGLAILVAGVRLETRGQAPVDRVLVAVAALGFAPVVYELLLGQTTLLIAAALYPVVRRADAFRNGVALGIVLALAPKPLLVPVLVWMMVWRRRALTSALVTALMLVCLGLLLLGPDQYRQWLSVLTGAGRESVSGTFSLSLKGNFSLWPLDPARITVAVAVGLSTLWVVLREPSRGFVAALLAGLLLAPYTGLYAATILLLAAKPALAFAPRAARVLALIANPTLVLLLALAAWSVSGLAACLPMARPGRARVPVGRP
jgi:Glycosyltransferase family 87